MEIPRTFSKVGWDSETPPEKIGIMLRSPARSIPRSRRQGSDHSGCLVEEEAKRMPEIEIIAEEICTEESGIDLRPLILALLPASKVVEDDIHWDGKSLLSEKFFRGGIKAPRCPCSLWFALARRNMIKDRCSCPLWFALVRRNMIKD